MQNKMKWMLGLAIASYAAAAQVGDVEVSVTDK